MGDFIFNLDTLLHGFIANRNIGYKLIRFFCKNVNSSKSVQRSQDVVLSLVSQDNTIILVIESAIVRIIQSSSHSCSGTR